MSLNGINSDFPEMLKLYYCRLFPFDTFCEWLSYSYEGQNQFEKREFSFKLFKGVYVRYNTFTSKDELLAELKREIPVKIDLGAEYNERPTRINKNRPSDYLKAVKRELIFDVDISDYNVIRKCCTGDDICEKCWKFMQIAVKIIDRALRDDFGFHHLLWLYSGRRGVHCWVCDREARSFNNRSRKGIADYLSVIPVDKNIKLYRRDTLHKIIRRSVNIIDKYWTDVCLNDQEILKTSEDKSQFLERISDENFKNDLIQEFEKYDNSIDRWNAFLTLYDDYSQRGVLKPEMIHIREEMKMFYTFPRIDTNVTIDLKHLLKSPFSIHPSTGRVCVPFKPQQIDEFNPFEVPTLRSLINELDSPPVDPTVPSTSTAQSSSVPSTSTDQSIIIPSTNKGKTNLRKYVIIFKQFLSRLRSLQGNPPNWEDF